MTGRLEAIAVAATLALLLAVTALDLSGHRLFVVGGASMEPTIGAQRYFLAWDPPGTLARGDLVLFRFEDADGVFHVLRRVVAFGGDTVSMRSGAVIVNGEPRPWAFRIVEPAAWRSPLTRDSNLYDWGPWVVPADSLIGRRSGTTSSPKLRASTVLVGLQSPRLALAIS